MMRKQLLCMTLCMLMIATTFAMVTPVLAAGNHAPAKPVLSGPTSGKRFISYTFSANTTDVDGDYISFNFSWGEGNYTGWIMPYVASGATVTAQYSWIKLGMYNVTVKAKDVYGNQSIVSDKVKISIVNDVPLKPVVSGPDLGLPGTYAYTVVGVDPDHDDISYYIDWGDTTNSGWRPFVHSGTPIDDVHTYALDGVYIIRARSKDVFGNISIWSDNLTVGISSLDIKSISGGVGIRAMITNEGTQVKTFDWTITAAKISVAPFLWVLRGGSNTSSHGYNTPDAVTLPPFGVLNISCPVFGFGFMHITVTISSNAKVLTEKSATGFLMGRRVILLGGV